MNKNKRNIFGLLWYWYTVLSGTAIISRSLQGSDFLSIKLLHVLVVLGTATIALMMGKVFNLHVYFVSAAVKTQRQIE